MAGFPLSVTLIGEEATNPALPEGNMSGTLDVKEGNLRFRGSGFTYRIPLEHIDECKVSEKYDASWGCARHFIFLTTLFFGGGIGLAGVISASSNADYIALPVVVGVFLALYYFYTATVHTIVIKAWDEEYGMDATTIIGIGRSVPDKDKTRQVVKTIWAIRGRVRNEAHENGRPVYRKSTS